MFSLASREKKSQVRETDVILKKVFESANSGSSSPLDWFVERTYAWSKSVFSRVKSV